MKLLLQPLLKLLLHVLLLYLLLLYLILIMSTKTFKQVINSKYFLQTTDREEDTLYINIKDKKEHVFNSVDSLIKGLDVNPFSFGYACTLASEKRAWSAKKRT